MSEKWTIERLFTDENSGNPFRKEPELMLLWECRAGKEAFLVWRGYDYTNLKETIRRAREQANADTTFCVEFPSRKGHRDSEFKEKRKFDGGAKCLPEEKNKFLVTLIENKWGATLNESVYMATRGRKLEFYMKSDKNKTPAFAFDNWNDVKEMAFLRRR